MVELGLWFTQIDCLRCGAQRQTRFACPECGLAPRATETDFHVQYRQRAIRNARDRTEGVTLQSWDSALDVLESGQVGSLTDRLFAVADRLAKDEDEAAIDDFASIAAEFASLRGWADSAVALRPLVAVTRGVVNAIRALDDLFDVVLQALETDSMAELRILQRSVQPLIDRAAAAIAPAGEAAANAAAVVDSDDPTAAWLELALAGADILDAARRGAQLFTVKTGLDCGPAVGLTAAIADCAVSVIGDRDRFWSICMGHMADLQPLRGPLAPILATSEFRKRYAEVAEDTWSAARAAATRPAPETYREFTSELLDHGHLLVEQSLKLHLGLPTAATSRRTFYQTQACDVSELVQIARDKRWSTSGALPTADLRNAFAHRDYEVIGDEVSLSPARRATRGDPKKLITLPELQDEVLSLAELALALDLAATAVAEASGSTGLELNGLHLLPTLLRGLSWSEVEISRHDADSVTIRATVPGALRVPTVASIAQFTLGFERLELELQRADTGRHRRFILPMEPMRKFAATDEELVRELCVIEILATATTDADPIVDATTASKCIAFRACEELAADHPHDETMRVLRPLRQSARSLGLDALQKELGRAMRWSASRETASAFDLTAEGTLFKIAGQATEPLPDELI